MSRRTIATQASRITVSPSCARGSVLCGTLSFPAAVWYRARPEECLPRCRDLDFRGPRNSKLLFSSTNVHGVPRRFIPVAISTEITKTIKSRIKLVLRNITLFPLFQQAVISCPRYTHRVDRSRLLASSYSHLNSSSRQFEIDFIQCSIYHLNLKKKKITSLYSKSKRLYIFNFWRRSGKHALNKWKSTNSYRITRWDDKITRLFE